MIQFQSTRPHGARLWRCRRPWGLSRFNPRARMGRDAATHQFRATVRTFQSTRPHGARLLAVPNFLERVLFQSARPHGARQLRRPHALRFDIVSIHAPRMGRSGSSTVWCWRITCFNPRARMGRDSNGGSASAVSNGFNPRARMGRDRSD